MYADAPLRSEDSNETRRSSTAALYAEHYDGEH